ncbi:MULTISPECIES: hypothetical protein [Actinosynnema]|uniref:hypothetical protein n=1 Tax=Actinosynnema TaxID=40566 RepID=UPI0020A3B631|nr:hypothetical protein [Actinosynnema pretiosum]MCP2098264.1 hypothetical protein [Actinosynnema pretiosum]
MAATVERVVTSMVLNPEGHAEVRLRGGMDGRLWLMIGPSVEIALTEAHAVALRGDLADALGEMRALDEADETAGKAYCAGSAATRAAAEALTRATTADLAGVPERAVHLRALAAKAREAGKVAAKAADAAATAFREAEDVTEAIAAELAETV